MCYPGGSRHILHSEYDSFTHTQDLFSYTHVSFTTVRSSCLQHFLFLLHSFANFFFQKEYFQNTDGREWSLKTFWDYVGKAQVNWCCWKWKWWTVDLLITSGVPGGMLHIIGKYVFFYDNKINWLHKCKIRGHYIESKSTL